MIINAPRYAGGPTILIQDFYTDTDTTLLPAHTPNIDTVGGGYTAVQNGHVINSNEIRTSATVSIDIIDCGASDISIAMDARPNSNAGAPGGGGFIYRYQDVNNFWLAHVDVFNTRIVMYERVSSTFNIRAETGISWVASQTYNITLDVSGTSHSIKVDGANEITYTSSALQSATITGIYDFLFVAGDNFVVTAP